MLLLILQVCFIARLESIHVAFKHPRNRRDHGCDWLKLNHDNLMYVTNIFLGVEVAELFVLKRNHSKFIFMADSKRVCLSNDEEHQRDIDRISDLPDSVLCHILSFLPTKMSVATSILSKRWIYLWTTVPVLSFSDTEHMGTFVNSVHQVLAMSRTRTIFKFSFDFEHKSEVAKLHLEKWIEFAIRRNIQELKLSLCCPLKQAVRLPTNVFACKTLVCLKLFDDVFVDVPTNVCFESLRILQLERVSYANEGSLGSLLSSCPIIEDLTVERRRGDNMLVLDIVVPSLKRVTVKRPSSETIPYINRILINAPLLERIEVLDTRCWACHVEYLPNLIEATIDVRFLYSGHGGVGISKAMVNIKFLSLSESECSFISYHCRKFVFTVFPNLVYLEIATCCRYWCHLIALLECSDNLKDLVFHIEVPLYHMGRKCGESLPNPVPKFVSMSLKTLRLTGFCDQDCNWKLVRYFLKNAMSLKQMKIGTSLRLMKQRHRLKTLLKYPRASMACEIGFFTDSLGQEVRL